MMNLNRISESTGLSLAECRSYRIEVARNTNMTAVFSL